MPSNVFSNLVAHAKAHHDSLNAAYQATYAPGLSATSTPTTSRKSSTTSHDSEHSDRNLTKAWKALKKHHREMNEAYSVFYSQGTCTPASSRSGSVAPPPKPISASGPEDTHAPRNIEKAWKAIKTRAVEHHRSVNNASAAVYGA